MSVTEQDLRPPHPLAEMVTWELTQYRRELERVLGLPELPPTYLPREQLHKQLDAVIAEQDERARIRHAKPEPGPAEAHISAIDAELAERSALRPENRW